MSLWTLTATAQEPVAETTSPVATETDSLQRVVDDLSQQLRHQKNEELDRKIWKNRSKYFNLGYVKQSLVFKDFGDEKLKNDFGVSISWGKTYYLHKKPLLGMLKFGLDWSWVDLNYSKYTISESEEPGSGSVGDIMDETGVLKRRNLCSLTLAIRNLNEAQKVFSSLGTNGPALCASRCAGPCPLRNVWQGKPRCPLCFHC